METDKIISIAICDDDISLVSDIEAKLKELANYVGVNVNLDFFYDGLFLYKSILNHNFYDIIYLDIEMEKLDGIEVAKKIRAIGDTCIIIYMSGYEEYLKDLFDVEPFRYLSKPLNDEIFKKVFMLAYKRISQHNTSYSFSYKKNLQKIPYKNIIYFESVGRIVRIHTTFDNLKDEIIYIFYGKLNNVEKEVSSSTPQFIRIHKSYLVNYDYIEKIAYTTLTLKSKDTISISKEYQKKARAKFCSLSSLEV